MHKLIYNRQRELLDWAGSKIGTEYYDVAHAIGIVSTNSITQLETVRAVVVFDHFTDGDCAMHIASDGSKHWLTPHFLATCFAYPFLQLNQRRVTSLVASKNQASLAFCKNCGFTVEGYLREGMPDDDLVVLGLLRRNCRFINPEFTRRVRRHPIG